MAKKDKIVYVCENCGADSPKWIGKCPYCQQWNTYKEKRLSASPGKKESIREGNTNEIQPLSKISLEKEPRISANYQEVNRVLGGGIVPGSVILIGGEPGIGKSTLALQIALKSKKLKSLYVSGEESLRQIKLRADRINIQNENLHLFNETSLEEVISQSKDFRPDLLIVDSIQTLYSENIDSSPGNITQVRESATQLLRFAKSSAIPIILIGHINKEGSIAGPKVLEHIVDVVLQFEGDHNYIYRVLRSLKNRFGSTSEIGIFEMHNFGLEEVLNPSELLVNQSKDKLSGVAIAATIDGIRPFLVEIQALVSSSPYGTPQRTTTGFDGRRLSMLLAVLEKKANLNLYNKDVFLNIAGGIKVVDTAIDLSIIAAVLSSLTDKSVPQNICFAGEVGLSGEIRAVSQIEQRIQEAEKIGFRKIIISGYNKLKTNTFAIETIKINTVRELLTSIFR